MENTKCQQASEQERKFGERYMLRPRANGDEIVGVEDLAEAAAEGGADEEDGREDAARDGAADGDDGEHELACEVDREVDDEARVGPPGGELKRRGTEERVDHLFGRRSEEGEAKREGEHRRAERDDQRVAVAREERAHQVAPRASVAAEP